MYFSIGYINTSFFLEAYLGNIDEMFTVVCTFKQHELQIYHSYVSSDCEQNGDTNIMSVGVVLLWSFASHGSCQ